MGRSYKRNDLYSSNRAKSLREKRKQSKTKYRRENVNNSTDYVEKYQQLCDYYIAEGICYDVQLA